LAPCHFSAFLGQRFSFGQRLGRRNFHGVIFCFLSNPADFVEHYHRFTLFPC
jgi:hypothetical protein